MTVPLFITSGDLIADRRYSLGRDYAADGDLVAAADLYVQATELAPGFASAWFALGEVRETLGDRIGAPRAASIRASSNIARALLRKAAPGASGIDA